MSVNHNWCTVIEAYREIGRLPLIIQNPVRLLEDQTSEIKEVLSPFKIVSDFLNLYRGPTSDIVVMIESKQMQFLYPIEKFLSRDYQIIEGHVEIFGERFNITEMSILFLIVYVPSWE